MVSGNCDLCLCFGCSFIEEVLSIIAFNIEKVFCKEVMLFTSLPVISSVPIIFSSFYSPQPVSVYSPKSFDYFLDFISQHFRLNSVQCSKQLSTHSYRLLLIHYTVPNCHYHRSICSEIHFMLNNFMTSFKYAYIQHN